MMLILVNGVVFRFEPPHLHPHLDPLGRAPETLALIERMLRAAEWVQITPTSETVPATLEEADAVVWVTWRLGGDVLSGWEFPTLPEGAVG